MTFGRTELGRGPVLEHGTTRTGRWLRERRLRLSLWIAVVEGVLVIVHAIPKSFALVVAALGIISYLVVGRKLGSDTGRQASWIVGASQIFVALIPALLIIVGTLALVALAVLAVVALAVLLADRR